MCSHYQALKERERYRRHFGAEPPLDPSKTDLWPGYLGSFIRRHPHADVGDAAVPEREALNGLFGLVPHWSVQRFCLSMAGMVSMSNSLGLLARYLSVALDEFMLFDWNWPKAPKYKIFSRLKIETNLSTYFQVATAYCALHPKNFAANMRVCRILEGVRRPTILVIGARCQLKCIAIFLRCNFRFRIYRRLCSDINFRTCQDVSGPLNA